MITCRTMEPYDIAAGLSLCRAAGWNQVARDWELFLHLSPNGCRVAATHDKIVGTVTTIRYQEFFSWIGMVLVDPDCRKQGIGMQLLKEALEILHDEETIKLDATPGGRAVYLKMDFVDEYNLLRMGMDTAPGRLNVSDVRPMQKDDLAAVTGSDRKIFGADRGPILHWMLEGAPQYAFVAEEQKEIGGYCMARDGYNFTHIGPVIAKNLNIAKNLVSAALNNSLRLPVILDVLQFDPGWMEWLLSIGFKEQRSLVRMYRGNNKHPGLPGKQFAILGPEFG